MGANEHAVTSTIVSPVHSVLPRDALKLPDLPVERIAPHGGRKLGSGVHALMILLMTSSLNNRTADISKFVLISDVPQQAHVVSL